MGAVGNAFFQHLDHPHVNLRTIRRRFHSAA
jgi:hypothetical protein